MLYKFLLFIVITLCSTTLFAADIPYENLSNRLKADAHNIKLLMHSELFKSDEKVFKAYQEQMLARQDLEKILSKQADEEAAKKYLFVLRSADKSLKKIEHLYFKALSKSIEENDRDRFLYLSTNYLEIIKKESIAKRVCTFYETACKGEDHQFLENLLDELSSNEKDYKEQMAESEEFARNLEVISAKELEEIKTAQPSKRKHQVLVSSEKVKDGFIYSASNFLPYRVSLSLKFKTLENFALSKAQPIYIELSANEVKEVVHIRQINKKKKAKMSMTYSYVMGSASAIHDDSVLYKLPFAKGSRVYVSQGFNGVSTHKGLSAYSVDFAAKVGTPIHAARSGIVFATQSIHNKGGFAKKFGKYANYVIIEHDDRTLGKYWHLKQGGVAVKMGERVEVGQLLGYSGNTGYTSGPHLHFNVSMVDPVSNVLPKSIPIRFQTKEGIVSVPKSGDQYIVQ